MAASFGITATVTAADGTTTYGYLQNVSITANTETAEARDEDGDVVKIDNFNATKDFSAEMIYTTTGTAPAVGAVLKVGAENYNLTSVALTETNTDYKKCSLSGKRYVDNTLPTT